MSINDHQIRDEVLNILKKNFDHILNSVEIQNTEIGIFNSSLEYAEKQHIPLTWQSSLFQDIYINKSRHIVSNLKSDCYVKNTYLSHKVKAKEINYKNMVYMTPENLFPSRWEDIIESKNKLFTDAYEVKEVAMSDSIKCGKCKNQKVTYYDLQTRSGDEAMTTYYTCLVCNYKWKH